MRELGIEGLGFSIRICYVTEMFSGSEAGSYLRLIDFVYHSTLGWRVMKKRRRRLKVWVFGSEFARNCFRDCIFLPARPLYGV